MASNIFFEKVLWPFIGGVVGLFVGALSPVGEELENIVATKTNQIVITSNDYDYSHQGLTDAIDDENIDIVRRFLSPTGLFQIDRVYTPLPNRFTPLWYAASRNKASVVRALLKDGANCNFIPAFGMNVDFFQAVMELKSDTQNFKPIQDIVKSNDECRISAGR